MTYVLAISDEDKAVLAGVFYQAAANITQYGWAIGDDIYATNSDVSDRKRPTCIYLSVTWIIESSTDLPNRYRYHDLATNVLAQHFGVEGIGLVFDLNDTITDNAEGKAWAISHLTAIADALSEGKVTVTDSIEKTDTGNVTSADGRVKRLLKRLHLAS